MDLRGIVPNVDINIEEHNQAVREYNRKFFLTIWGALGGVFLITILIFLLIEG